MPTNIKRKIHKPPIYINDEVGCNKNYGNDASCYDETTVKVDFPNGNCCEPIILKVENGRFVISVPERYMKHPIRLFRKPIGAVDWAFYDYGSPKYFFDTYLRVQAGFSYVVAYGNKWDWDTFTYINDEDILSNVVTT